LKDSSYNELLDFFRRSRVEGFAGVKKGNKPEHSRPLGSEFTIGQVIVGSIGFGLIGLVAGTAFYSFFPQYQAVYSHYQNPSAFIKAFDIGVITFYVALLWPLIPFGISLFTSKLPTWEIFVSFASYFALYAMVGALPLVSWIKSLKRWEFGFMGTIGLWVVVSISLFVMAMIIAGVFDLWSTRKRRFSGGDFIRNMKRPIGKFGVWVGSSTGELSALSHGSGMDSGQHVVLSLEDACQNIAIMGGIGTGKTTRAVQPLLLQLLDQECGGLIFDIKGDFKKAVHTLAGVVEKPVITIGPSQVGMNLLQGLSPEVASSFLKSAFLLSGESRENPFWINTATELCRNALGVLSFLPGNYNLVALYRYLFEREFRVFTDSIMDELKKDLDPSDERLLESYLSYRKNIFSGFDDKVVSGVNATVAQVLSPFNQPELVDAFCSESEDLASMGDVLGGTIFLVDLPLSRWGLGGKVVYTLIKLRFFNVMQRRLSEPNWNQDRPVFFICDEFQEIVSCSRDGLSDLNFWDKSRSSKTIGIISGQSVSSFNAAIGQRDMAHALLQNFRQKICFETEDQATLDHLNHLLGRVDVPQESYQRSRTSGSSSSGSLLGSSNSSTTSGVTKALKEKTVLNPQVIRNLGKDQAIAVLSLNSQSSDDVINMRPVFV
jgi:type IV secretory pathway TraG/TraD family ATPase VirD4